MNEEQVRKIIQEEIDAAINQESYLPRTVKPRHIEVAFGSMYASQAAIVVTVAAADTWYEVTSGLSDGGNNVGVEFQNDYQLKVNYGGKYLAIRAVGMGTSTAADEVMGTTGVNGTADETVAGETSVQSANKKTTTTGNGILDLEAGDLVSVFVQNEDAARDITIEHITLTIIRIGDLD